MSTSFTLNVRKWFDRKFATFISGLMTGILFAVLFFAAFFGFPFTA